MDLPDSVRPMPGRKPRRWPAARFSRWFTDLADTRDTATPVPTPLRVRRSLYAEIVDFVFAPLALIWPVSLALTFFIARSLADMPFDRALDERLRALTNYIEITRTFTPPAGLVGPSGMGPTPLSQSGTAFPLLSLDGTPADRHTFRVRSADGIVLAGDRTLPEVPTPRGDATGTIVRSTVTLYDQDWRVASIWIPHLEGVASVQAPILVQVAETLDRRNALANDIIRGVIVPQFLILPLAVLLVWFGLSRGLHPLQAVQARIRERLPDDYSPIDLHGTPDEVTPLVDTFNDLLARLAQNSAAQRRFIADAAHQLKTPLAGLRTQAELALHTDDPDEIRASLKLIAHSADRSARMVSQLLTLARTEHRSMQLPVLQPVDLGALARDITAHWIPRSLHQNIDLGYEGPESSCFVRGDPLLLHELLNNLVDNALRYVGQGGAVTVRITVPSSSQHPIILAVEDNGPGIAPADQQRIFDRFYRVLGNATEGSGLGLAIVREIARMLGSEVQLVSPVWKPASVPASMTPTDRADDTDAAAVCGGPGSRFEIAFSPAHAPE